MQRVACQKAAETGADGIMLGRAIFGNPWLFAGGERSDLMEPSIETKLKVLIEHTKLFEKLLGEHKNFAIMKKHFKAYVEGFAGAKELRMKLMEAVSASEVEHRCSLYREPMTRVLQNHQAVTSNSGLPVAFSLE